MTRSGSHLVVDPMLKLAAWCVGPVRVGVVRAPLMDGVLVVVRVWVVARPVPLVPLVSEVRRQLGA